MKPLWIPFSVVLLLEGCSAFSPRSGPAPVSDAGYRRHQPARAAVAPAPTPAPGVRIYPYHPGPGPASAPSGEATLAMRTPAPGFRASPPVQALMKQAEAQQAAGDLAGAGTVLERALRIEPRNPYLWNRLARVRLEQGQYPQAGILAAKSSTLAGDLPELQRDNRRIAAAARRGNGR